MYASVREEQENTGGFYSIRQGWVMFKTITFCLYLCLSIQLIITFVKTSKTKSMLGVCTSCFYTISLQKNINQNRFVN